MYTVEDAEKLTSDDIRAELIDGEVYEKAAPSWTHQRIIASLMFEIYGYIKQNNADCEVLSAPFPVYLDEHNVFEPDISVICDRDKLDQKGCHGAPDWVIEVAGLNTMRQDYILKFYHYYEAGVRLYWIVNPLQKKVVVWNFQKDHSVEYPFDEKIPVELYTDFSILLPELEAELE